MNSTKNIAIATVLTAILSLNTIGPVQAADAAFKRVMKPLQGISFDVGTKRAVSYFLSENGTCRLVLSLAAAPNWDEMSSLEVTRFEAALPANEETHFRSAEGKVLEFACGAGAKSMSVEVVEQIAIGAIR